VQSFDAIVIGGGPGGSSCAAGLSKTGMRVAVLDRARFPRVKLCAGWLSSPLWDLLETSPESYPGQLWPWKRCHVHYLGKHYSTRSSGYFIRRYEFDDWMLSASGATVFRHPAKRIRREDGEWIVDGAFRAEYLVGAGGTHCPVARTVFPRKTSRPVGAQELEFEAAQTDIAAARIGEDGEPELVLHQDLAGYSWNIPKSTWLNIGCGTVDPKKVKGAWSEAREFFQDQQHVPTSAFSELEHAKGHSYFLFDPEHLHDCQHQNAFLVGDALGLAQPLTAEGIMPAILSGRLCAQAITRREPWSYRSRLQSHPIFADYDFLYRMREKVSSMRTRSRSAAANRPSSALLKRLTNSAIASGFSWMFSGRPVPGRGLRRLLRRAL